MFLYAILFLNTVPLIPALNEKFVTTTWVWPPLRPDEDVDLFLSDLSLSSSRDKSFIRLVRMDDMISIDLIQKGRSWEGSFCSTMLPATMAQFIASHGIDIEKDISRIKVYNVAEPRVRGCVCYVKLMVSMGFNFVNRWRLREKDVPRFCERMPYEIHRITAKRFRNKGSKLPNFHEKALALLAFASIYDSYWA